MSSNNNVSNIERESMSSSDSSEWEPLTDFEDDYEIEIEAPHRIRRKRDGLILKTTLHKTLGYVLVRLNGRSYRYHRILAKHFIPNPDDLPEVDHIDRNKTNNSLENLRWVSPSENMKNRAKYSQQKREFLDHAPNDIIEIRTFNDVNYPADRYFFCFTNDRVIQRVNDHKWRYLNMTPHTGYLCINLRDINEHNHQIYMHKLIQHFRNEPAADENVNE